MILRTVHDLLTGALHLERRIDPFIRPAFDAVAREPLTRACEWLINMQSKNDHLPLVTEQEQPGEAELLQSMIDSMRAHMAQDFAPGAVERGGNTKTHGMLTAMLTVLPNLAPNLRHGVFATERSYPAWVRFAGPGPHIEPDIDDVGFGSMSVKLMDVPGDKLMDDEVETQDFTAGTTPSFTTGDTRSNAHLQKWSKRELGLFHFLDPTDPHILDLLMNGLWTKTIGNPLAGTYYSTVPYLLGPGQAMQYRFRPLTAVNTRIAGLPMRPADNYLRDNMQDWLGTRPASFELCVQVQTDSFRMPIESAAVRWPDRLSPPVPVARLDIPAQHFDTPERFGLARLFRFNPWHSLAEHRPLGNQNRARGRMYRELAEYRQAMNGVAHIEPKPGMFA